MKKRSILLFISLMFLALSACSDTGLPTIDFEHTIDKDNPLKIHFSTVMPNSEEYGDLTLEWDMGDGTILKDSEVTHTYKDQGDYKVKLSLISSKDFLSPSKTIKTVSVYVNFKNIDFTFVQDNSLTPTVTFTAQGSVEVGSLKFDWTFTDNDHLTASGNEVKRTYASRKIVKVILTAKAENTNAYVTIEKDIDLTPKITSISFKRFAFEPNVPLKADFTATTTPEIEGLYYVWNFGDGTPDKVYEQGQSTSRHIYDNGTSGLHTVKVTVKTDEHDTGITHSEQVQIGDIHAETYFTYDINPQYPLEVAFSPNTNPSMDGVIYSWNFNGTGFIEHTPQFLYTFTEYGPNYVTLKAVIPDNATPSYDNRSIYLTPQSTETFDFTITPTNHPLEFKVEATGKVNGAGSTEFIWSIKGEQVATGKTALIKFSDYSNENITLTVKIDGIVFGDIISHGIIIPEPDFTVNFTYKPIREVNPLEVYFKGSSSIIPKDNSTFKYEVEYYWDFKFGNTAKGQEINHTFNYTATYQVTMTAKIVGTTIERSITKNVIVHNDVLAKINCMQRSGININNLIYECSVEASPLLENPQFKWEVKLSDNKTVIKESVERSFEIKFDKLDLYNITLYIKDLVFENGETTIHEKIAVLTTPIIEHNTRVYKCSWGDKSIHSTVLNTWGRDKINRENVKISIWIEENAYYRASRGYHPIANNNHIIQGKNPGDKKNPWNVTVDTDVRITYTIDGFKSVSKLQNLYLHKNSKCP